MKKILITIIFTGILFSTIAQNVSKTKIADSDIMFTAIGGYRTANPPVDFVYEKIGPLTYKFINTTTGFTPDSLYWDFGDGGSPTANVDTVTHTYSGVGDYEACLFVYPPATVTPDSLCKLIAVSPISSIDENYGNSQLRIYPNPVLDELNIEIHLNDFTDLKIDIYNSLGIKVHSDNIHILKGKLQKTIDTSNLSAGLYILQIRAGEKAFLKKLNIY